MKEQEKKALKGTREKLNLTMKKSDSNNSGFLIKNQKEVAYHFSGDESKKYSSQNRIPCKINH